jgi:DNA-binding LacI/PurR family transcriptional regulator
MPANINAVAQKCGVSKGTVSNVFTGRPGVSEAVKQRILQVARELNYTPKQVAAQRQIAVIVDHVHKAAAGRAPFYYILLSDLIRDITRLGYLVKIVTPDEIGTLMKSYTKVAVLMISEKTLERHDATLKGLGIPLITVNQVLPYAHAVCLDHDDENRKAVDHLVANGHRNIVMAMDNSTNWAGQERLRGYAAAMKRHGLSVVPPFSYLDNNFSMLEVMAKIRKSDATAAIICGESLVAETTYASNLLDIRIPDDLSIISFEQTDWSKWLSPPHTTIDQKIDDFSEAIAALIETLVKKPKSERSVTMLTADLIIRNSVKDLRLSETALQPA